VVDEARVKRKIPELLENDRTKYFRVRKKAMTLERNDPNAFKSCLRKIVMNLDDIERKMYATDFEFHGLRKKKK
jgi:hypothetical protein